VRLPVPSWADEQPLPVPDALAGGITLERLCSSPRRAVLAEVVAMLTDVVSLAMPRPLAGAEVSASAKATPATARRLVALRELGG